MSVHCLFFLVFTPLFLGAELHIPTSEDIGVPGRLATWMAEHEVTITHLTPGKIINFCLYINLLS